MMGIGKQNEHDKIRQTDFLDNKPFYSFGGREKS
jgi:hypothetical protein